jgi:peptidoglycan/xylan/chitin deacetylase (PgdA/CDA1 family)
MHSDLERLQAERLRRRRDQQRRMRRQRAVAGAAVVLVVVIVVVIAVAASGGGASKQKPTASVHEAAPKQAGSAASATTPHSTVTGTPTGKPGTAAVPILMYHVIAPPPAGAPFPGLYVPEPEFAAQMQALKQAGWQAVTMDQLEAFWTKGVALPGHGKPIVLSFDNGYHSQYASAMPVLKRLGWVGDENIQLQGLPPSQGGLTTAEVKGLIDAGWELDTQGISHADLIALSPSELSYQVATARKIIQRRYHVPVNWFCYPSGHYNATVIREVKAAGYVGSTTVVPGWASNSSDPYRLPRLRVLGGTSPSSLLSEIASIRNDPAPPASYSG